MEHLQEDLQEESSFDFKLYLNKVLPKWWLFVIFVAGCLAFAYYKNRYEVSQYRSKASILLVKQDNSMSLAGIRSIVPTVDIDNEVGQLKSNTIASQALKLVNFETTYFLAGHYAADRELYKKSCPFNIEYDYNHPQLNYKKFNVSFLGDNRYKLWIEDDVENYWTSSINEWVETEQFKFRLYPAYADETSFLKGKNYKFIKNTSDGLVSYYSSRLIVNQRSAESSIVTLSVIGECPEKLNDYVNAVAKVYIDYSLEHKNNVIRKTIAFIDSVLVSLDDSLDVNKLNILNFERAQSNNFDLNVLTDSISDLHTISQIFESIKKKEEYYNYIKGVLEDPNSDLASIVPMQLYGVSDQILQAQFEKIDEVLQEKSLLNFSVRDGQKLTPYQLNDYKISEIISNMLKYIEVAQDMLSKRKRELTKRFDEVKKELLEKPNIDWQKHKLTKKFELNNELYNKLLNRRYEASISMVSNEPDASIVDLATNNTVEYLQTIGGFSYSKAVIIGFLIPAAILFLIIFFDDKISEVSEIEKATGETPLGMIPHNHHQSALPVATHPNSSIAEAFRALRTNIQFLDPDNHHKVIVLTSTFSGEGKTFNTVNLAVITGKFGKRCLLVGLDLRKPRIQEYFDIKNENGISTYLIGECTIDQLINHTCYENLDFVLPGPIPPNPSELIGSEAMKTFIDTVSPRYDYIFIDAAPIGIVTDAMLLSNYTSRFLFVIRQKMSKRDVLKFYIELKNSNLKNINIIFNGIRRSKHGHYGYGNYGNYYSGGYYSDDDSLDHNSLVYKVKRAFRKVFSRRHKS
ncbi:MAG: polysaccharide biosynthesis tyrosine autokinase [Bacteroidales bacterium]|nr:polysaccharide biosynthesis tyrosine autokinase [Bacteroidales bacterium]